MKRFLSLVVVWTSLVLVGPLWAQQSEPAWKRLQQETLTVPETYEERIRRLGSVLELSLNDAIRLALTNNLELAIEDYNEDLSRERVIETRGFYDPGLTLQFGWNSSETPTVSELDTGFLGSRLDKSWFLSSILTQNVAGGGAFSVRFDNNRFATNNTFSFLNPRFGSFFRVQYRQPVWRGFKQTNTQRLIKLYNLDTEISDSQFQQKVSDIVDRVERQYWELVFAVQNYEAQRQSVELAIVQFENNKKRARIGSLAPIEITASRTEVAGREQSMVQSEIQIINAENTLKTLVAPDPQDPLWNLTLFPTDQPQMLDLKVSLKEAVDTALNRRPELEQLRLEGSQNEVNRQFLKKEGKPALDLLASLSSQGSAGRVLDAGNPFAGNFSDTLSQTFGFDFVSYSLAVEVTIPIRNRSNGARLAQVALAQRQLQDRIRNQEQAILAEVRNAYQSTGTEKKRVDIAHLTRQLAQEQLVGETKRFEAGLSTNFEVLRFQRDLTDARTTELRSLIDYRLAVAQLRKAMYTIVDENDIVVARSRNRN